MHIKKSIVAVLVVAIIVLVVVLAVVLIWDDSSKQGANLDVSCDEGVDYVKGSGQYAKNTFADLHVETKDGYAFVGWYDEDGKLLSDKREYRIFMQESTKLEVKTLRGYEVTVYTMAGIDTVIGAGVHGFSETVTLEATVKNGFTFAGWYGLDGKLVNKEPTYVLDEMIDTILVAKTMEPSTVGKGPIYYTDSRADTWVVTDWYTGDYVFSKTGSTFFEVYLVPGVYMVKAYGSGMEYLGFYKELMDGNVVKEFSWTSGSETYTEKWDADYGDYRRSAVSDDLRAPATDHDRMMFVKHVQNSVKIWANHLKTLSSGMTPLQRADFVLDFVQQCIVYESDKDYCGGEDYWKCPYETLFDGRGDCEDSAILYCELMRCMGYEVALVLFEEAERYVGAGDVVAAVMLDDISDRFSYTAFDKTYFYCDTIDVTHDVGYDPGYHDEVRILFLN